MAANGETTTMTVEAGSKEEGTPGGWPQFGGLKKPFSLKPMVKIISEDARVWAQSQDFVPTDVLIMTFPKSGTTWFQNICEQIRCGGTGYDHFSEVTEVVPWLEMMHEIGQTMEEQNDRPFRCFKTHQRPSAFGPTPKFISTVRNPEDVLLSWHSYNQQKQVITGFKDANEMVEVAHEGFGGDNIFGTNVWDYYLELWEIRNEPNVLVVCYEELKKDSANGYQNFLPHIAKIMGVEYTDELGEKVGKYISMDMMKQFPGKFDGNFVSSKKKEKGDKPAPLVSKVDTHKGKKPKLSEVTKAWMDEQWKMNITPKTGHATYEEFAADIAALLKKEG